MCERILSSSIRLPSFGGNNQDCGCMAVSVPLIKEVQDRKYLLAGIILLFTQESHTRECWL
jgi:hypothetical protein